MGNPNIESSTYTTARFVQGEIKVTLNMKERTSDFLFEIQRTPLCQLPQPLCDVASSTPTASSDQYMGRRQTCALTDSSAVASATFFANA